MLQIRNIEVYGLDKSIVASGNPMSTGEINSSRQFEMNDLERIKRLGMALSGSGHDNALKGIIVQFDVKYPQYWTPEAQRYHWLDIVSSQSKMHRLTTCGKSEDFFKMFNKYVDESVIANVQNYIKSYNEAETPEAKYGFFMKALSNLPMGYEMWETISTNYLQLKTVYKQRKNHKLKEDWGPFCDMCRNLPLFLKMIGEEEET